MTFESLPKEILHQIFFSQSHSPADLRSYSLVCRNFTDIAREALYRDIDLTFDERVDEATDEKTEEKQLQLLMTIASYEHIGRHVRTFRNFHPCHISHMQDVTLGTEDGMSEVVVQAARNMKFLRKASFEEGPFAIEVITHLESYSRLTDLTVTGFKPEEFIWRPFTTALKRLRWMLPTRHGDQNSPTETAEFLIKVARSTCPTLESLDITLSGIPPYRQPLERRAISASQYKHIKISDVPILTELRHFGLKYERAYSAEQFELGRLIFEFVTQHSHTLTSVSLPMKFGGITMETTTFILRVCTALPHLTELSLVESTCSAGGGLGITGLEFLTHLTSALASPIREIKKFSITSTTDYLSTDAGNLFASWQSLEFLRLGDIKYVDDNGMDITSYGPHILGFITALPQSLQELYLEINGFNFFLDDTMDFDIICTFAFDIFNRLIKLHTCDIQAWVPEEGNYMGDRYIPHKAVFYRRLPCPNSRAELQTKELWTSRMDCGSEGGEPKVTKWSQVLEGSFEGEDAEEVWLHGYTNEGGWPEYQVDHSWPGWVNKVDNYPMFRENT